MKYEIGARIKKYRELKGLSQKDFAILIGVGNTRVSNWEAGFNRPDVDLLASICDALEVSPGDLLGLSAQKKEPPASEDAGGVTDDQVRRAYAVAEALTPEDLEKWFEYSELLILRRKQSLPPTHRS